MKSCLGILDGSTKSSGLLSPCYRLACLSEVTLPSLGVAILLGRWL